MNVQDPEHAELVQLIHAMCDETAAELERERLYELLAGRTDRQRLYLEHIQLDAALRWDLGAKAEHDAVATMRSLARSAAAPPHGEALNGRALASRSVANRQQTRPRRPAFAPRAAAAALVAAIGLSWAWFWLARADRKPVEAPIARLIASDAKLDFSGEIGRDDALSAGVLRLNAGLVRIEFAGGATVTLDAPAELELRSSMACALRHGHLTARAAPSAVGFRIDTPAASVVDLGTAFGLAVDRSGRSDVCVFEGEVYVTLPERAVDDEGSKRLLREGEAVRVDSSQGAIAAVDFNAAPFARGWPMSFGVRQSTGVVHFDDPGPPTRPHQHEHDERIMIFPERDAVVLNAPIEVSVTAAGRHQALANLSARVAAGRGVRSYLLQFNPVGQRSDSYRLPGSVTFEGEIIGLITRGDQLAATDAALGGRRFEYTAAPDRGLEGPDWCTLSGDRRTLVLDWKAGSSLDQMRVLVEAAP